jgi:hypothetical protein
LTALTVLFGLWYRDIADALAIEAPETGENLADQGAVRARLSVALWGRLFPLGLATVALASIFLPVGWPLTSGGVAKLAARGTDALLTYDPIPTAISAVWFFMLCLLLYIGQAAVKLGIMANRYRL